LVVPTLKFKQMKKLLPFFSIAIVFAACNPTPKSLTESASQNSVQQIQSVQPDTTGLSQYQAWKAQNELASVQQYNQVQPSAPVVKTVKYAPKPAVKKPAPVVTQPRPVDNPAPSTNAGSGTDVATNGSANTESAGEAKAAQKKGISKAAKGAVIGGVVGAAGGAVINKNNRVLGAVIGGVVGAAGGYGIGRGMDKKDGRIEYSRIEL
jgi:hypothetical protein